MCGSCTLNASCAVADGEDSPESLFKRELAKRGLTGGAVKADEREDSGRFSCCWMLAHMRLVTALQSQASSCGVRRASRHVSQMSRSSHAGAKPSLPQGKSDGSTGGQLERSRKLNSEGLEARMKGYNVLSADQDT